MPVVAPRWESLACDAAAASVLAAELKVPEIVARLLCQRGFADPAVAARFLSPSLDHLHDPLLMAGMPAAVERLLAAIARKERIAIHGDYDVDGITSTVILRRALELLGGTSSTSYPSGSRTVTACSPRRSSGCTRTASP